MRSRLITALRRLECAASSNNAFGTRQQGAALSVSRVLRVPSAQGESCAGLSGPTPLPAAFIGATALGSTSSFFTTSAAGFANEDEAAELREDEKGLVEVSSGDSSQRLPVAVVAAYVREHLHDIKPPQLTHIIEQLIDLYFAEAEDDSQRTSRPLGEAMTAIVEAVLHEGSPLKDNGEVVSQLLWGAYRLGLATGGGRRGADLKALVAAAERSVDSCNKHGVDIAHTLCALGGMHLIPSSTYLDRVAERLVDEGIAQNMSTDYLILALQGTTLLYHVPKKATDVLVTELLKRSTSDGLDAVEISRLARLLPGMAPSQARADIAGQVFSQVEAAAPFMDLFAINMVLSCAAKLSYPLPPEVLRLLVERAGAQLGVEGAFSVAGTLLWSLGKLGCRQDDGILSDDFLRACVNVHMSAVVRLAHEGALKVPFRVPLRGSPIAQALADFLDGCVLLRLELNEQALQAHADLLEERHDFEVDEQALRLMQSAFNAFRFDRGVTACKERLGIYGWGRL